MAQRNAQEEAERATTVEERTAYTLELLGKMLNLPGASEADGVLRHLQHRARATSWPPWWYTAAPGR